MSTPAAPGLGRFAVAAGVALGVALLVSHLLLSAELELASVAREQRLGTVSLMALTELAQRAGDDGDKLREVVGAWQVANPVRTLRVVRFAGLMLEASSAPQDQGELAAPRRLKKEEKALYDRGQRLRAAVETNRDEGQSRKDELELASTPGGGWTLAGPLLQGADVVGLVELETRPGPPADRAPLGVAAGSGLGALLLVLLASVLLARRSRWLVVGLGGAAVTFAVLGHGWYARRSLLEARRASDQAVASHALQQLARLTELSTAAGLTGALPNPGSWDCDAFRHARGALGPDGAVLERDHPPTPSTRVLVALALLAVGIFWVIGLGGASWLGRTMRDHRVAYAYIAPAMLGMAALVFFPFFYGIALSFTDANLYNASRPLAETWVGLKNYGDILFDFDVMTRNATGALVVNYGNFYWTLLFTIIWTVSNVTIGVTVGLALALALNIKGLALRPVYRVLLILPWAVPNYITALIWRGMFHRQFGVINHLLQLLGGQPRSWFDEPVSSFSTALMTNGWLSFPFMMVVSLGALQSIPDELYEAAEVDGASRWQQFRAITLPALRPALVPAIILSVVWTFNMFNIIYLVTAGAPDGATEILVTQAFKHAFERYRYGYAAAYSTIIFLILLVYGTFQNRVSRATEA